MVSVYPNGEKRADTDDVVKILEKIARDIETLVREQNQPTCIGYPKK